MFIILKFLHWCSIVFDYYNKPLPTPVSRHYDFSLANISQHYYGTVVISKLLNTLVISDFLQCYVYPISICDTDTLLQLRSIKVITLYMLSVYSIVT